MPRPYDKERILRQRAVAKIFVDEINARTVCAHCGEQPIEWHNPDHVALNRRHFRIGVMVVRGVSIEGIQAEMAQCTPLCRRCHLIADGRMAWIVANAPRHERPPKPCQSCARLSKPLRKGLCGTCAARQRRAQITATGETLGTVERRRNYLRTRT